MSTLDMTRIHDALDGLYARIRYVEEIASTNTALMETDEVANRSVLLTNSQTAGKGRLGRTWVAPKGTQVTMSVMLLPDSLEHLGTLPLAAGLAVTDALPGTVLKWPNDVLLEEKKLCGILAEAGAAAPASGKIETPAGKIETPASGKIETPASGKIELVPSTAAARVVLGMGINVSLAQEDLPVPHATSLLLAGRDADRTQVAIDVLTCLDRRIKQWEENDPRLMEDYRKVCSSIGRQVRLEAPGGDITGIVEGVGDDGRINVGGTYYSAGDVIHLRRM